jgi:hypothetical protein
MMYIISECMIFLYTTTTTITTTKTTTTPSLPPSLTPSHSLFVSSGALELGLVRRWW